MKQRKGFNFINVDGNAYGQLYDTVIYKQEAEVITLNSGGWKTNHTKNCINDVLPDGYNLYQKQFEWYVSTPDGVIDFEDNMKLNIGGNNE